jgi:hypothetical protein
MELKNDKITSSVEFYFPLVYGVTILADATHNVALIIKHIMLKFNKILFGGNYGDASVLTAKNRQKTDASSPGMKNKIIEKMKKNEEK